MIHKEVDKILGHMSQSHEQMAKILGSNKTTSKSISTMIGQFPDVNPMLGDQEALVTNSLDVTRNIAVYLKALSELEEALAASLSIVMKQLLVEEEE
jgi:hypothetical protein